jgi:hypothetical protein
MQHLIIFLLMMCVTHQSEPSCAAARALLMCTDSVWCMCLLCFAMLSQDALV